MNEYEEYKRQREIERGKEYQKKKDWLIGQWKGNPENYAEEIFFETEETELKGILKSLKKTNPAGHKFLKDFDLIWSLMFKKESEIIAFLKAKNLYSQLEYFITICENGNKKIYRNELGGLSKKQRDETTIATIKKNLSGNGWSKLISVFKKALESEPKKREVKDKLQVVDRLTDFEKLFDAEKLKVYKELESEFFSDGWQERKLSFAAFIQAMILADFFLKNLKPNGRSGRSKIRVSFEEKFNLQINDQFKPSKIDSTEQKIWIDKIKSRST